MAGATGAEGEDEELGGRSSTQSTLGFIPIFGNDVGLHAVTAAIAVYFGFIATPDLLELSTSQQSGTRSEG